MGAQSHQRASCRTSPLRRKEDSPVLISPAYAQAAAASPGSDMMAFLPMVAIFVVFYFLLIRPQQKRAKETKAMLAALQKGDEVVTAGGIVGKVVEARRRVRDRRNRAECRDHRPAQRDLADAPQGHGEDPFDPQGARALRSNMNRYPFWKYALIVVALVVGILYTLPNFFAEVPAVQVSTSKATIKIDASTLQTVEDDAQGRRHRLLGRGARRDRHQGAACRRGYAAQGEGRAPAEARRELHRRAQPAVEFAAVAVGDRRAADVPGPRPARRRAFPVAGRHEGRPRQGRRPLSDRHALAAAREEGAVRRHRARRTERLGPLPRCGGAQPGQPGDRQGVPGPASSRKPTSAASSS